jgi:hypothetical protein
LPPLRPRSLLAALALALPLAGCGSTSAGSGDAANAAAVSSAGTSSTAVVGAIDRTAAAAPAATVAGESTADATTVTVGSTGAAEVSTPADDPAAAASGTGSSATATTTTTAKSAGGAGGAAKAGSTTASAPPPTAPTVKAQPSAAPAAAATKSIAGWVSCSGTADDTAGVQKAFSAAKNGAFTLIVDCPVNVKVGSDIARTIFIDNGTTIEFTGAGKFTVDNVQIPAFVIADSSNITLTNWNVEYNAGMSVNERIGFSTNGQFNDGLAGNAFNDSRLTPWLAANRGIVFDRRAGSVNSFWTGTTNACAVFYISGDSANVEVQGLHLYVPASAGGNRFIPVAFTLGMNYRRNQTVTSKTPQTGQHFAIPQDITFSNVTLDGTYMGWVGSLKNSVFENIQSHRYGDLQDANGRNVGGVGKWFAPPHLFYFNYPVDGDPALFNTNIQIKHVLDHGIRVGKARDLGGKDSISGYANSLKLGCVNCSVDDYQSFRPDGFMDVLTSDGLTVSNVTATYNSSFTNNLYPGWRFPSAAYKNLKFENVSLKDLAAVTIIEPIGNANVVGANQNLVFSNVQVGMNKWNHSVPPFPFILGEDDSLAFTYSMGSDLSQHLLSVANNVQVQLVASPATVHAGQTTAFKWLSWQANSCSVAGAWTAALGTTGSRALKMAKPGTYNFTVSCRNSGTTTTATAKVVVL